MSGMNILMVMRRRALRSAAVETRTRRRGPTRRRRPAPGHRGVDTERFGAGLQGDRGRGARGNASPFGRRGGGRHGSRVERDDAVGDGDDALADESGQHPIEIGVDDGGQFRALDALFREDDAQTERLLAVERQVGPGRADVARADHVVEAPFPEGGGDADVSPETAASRSKTTSFGSGRAPVRDAARNVGTGIGTENDRSPHPNSNRRTATAPDCSAFSSTNDGSSS
ncbi:hypothetical protein ACFQJD_02605 [Haloplanus sp. GCM10025708]|uniref:hypothetical protein n=1 Tax=Haloplanus sp. GCM10025708 TaxID=3252679 RepID=UPI0036212B8F